MNIQSGFKTLSLTACLGLASLALAGCMSTNQDQGAESAAARGNSLKFVNATSASLARATAQGKDSGETQIDFGAIGCPKLAALFKDFGSYHGGDLPQSVQDYLACFGIDGSFTAEDNDKIQAKLQNPKELLDCVCGGPGLTAFFDDLTWQTFSANASTAAGTSFDGSKSNAGGTSFSGSSSTAAGVTFDGSKSNAGGETFSGK